MGNACVIVTRPVMPMKGMQVFQTKFVVLQTVSITHELHCRTICVGDDNCTGSHLNHNQLQQSVCGMLSACQGAKSTTDLQKQGKIPKG